MRVLVFDTEATGLPKTKIINPDTLHLWPHIVQFSYLIYDTELNDVVVVEDNIVKVGAGINIPAESTAIHGITNGMSQTEGVSLSHVLQRIGW
jgi:DNA polymerase III epsilon subunit-like protein